MRSPTHRAPATLTDAAVVVLTVLAGLFSTVTAAGAQPSSIAPPPPPVIGPLEYGPPAYPPAVGVPLLPQARAGVGVSADTLNPTASGSAPAPAGGIAGVVVSADVVNPVPVPSAEQAPGGR
ncbi:hypothetical protein [Mycolicibacterium mengxianglii]|uniref:hypothetical protein n=1 Tax=Mycolicibacterium mengxianglii TaxID=2736649 RepID=UPI0018EED2C2|nr:hypothetical protein [Mycolicibacterium mengxianglii]